MTLYVQVVDNEVKQVWDTVPPEGQDGWREAVEIRPTLIANRQGYTAHRFDLTTTPIQIIWDTYDIPVDQRRSDMRSNAGFKFQQVLQEQARNPETYDAALIEAARQEMLAKQAQIDAATTHDELDALV